MAGMGKLIVVFGVVLIGIGILLMMVERIPYLGKLPGDIHIKKEHFRLFIPITSSIIVSLVVSGVVMLISYLLKK